MSKGTRSLHWRHNDHEASQITSLTIFVSTSYSDADQRKHQSSASLAFLRGIHRGPVNSPQKTASLVTRKMFPFDDVIMQSFDKELIWFIYSYAEWIITTTEQSTKKPCSNSTGYTVMANCLNKLIWAWWYSSKLLFNPFSINFVWCQLNWDIGFNHGLPWYVKNMARGTQVDKNRGRRPRFLSWLRPEGHVLNIAWQAMIKTYYSMSPFAI